MPISFPDYLLLVIDETARTTGGKVPFGNGVA